jgi:hypothetical protein
MAMGGGYRIVHACGGRITRTDAHVFQLKNNIGDKKGIVGNLCMILLKST